MVHFLFIVPPPYKHIDQWDVKYLLLLLGNWTVASLLTNFELAWKQLLFLAHGTAKHCSDFTLMCIDYQYLFLQYIVVIFLPESDVKMD